MNSPALSTTGCTGGESFSTNSVGKDGTRSNNSSSDGGRGKFSFSDSLSVSTATELHSSADSSVDMAIDSYAEWFDTIGTSIFVLFSINVRIFVLRLKIGILSRFFCSYAPTSIWVRPSEMVGSPIFGQSGLAINCFSMIWYAWRAGRISFKRGHAH